MAVLMRDNYFLFCQWTFTTSMQKNYWRASIHLPTLNTGVYSFITTVKINHTWNNSLVVQISIQNYKIITYFQNCPFTKFSYVKSVICSVFFFKNVLRRFHCSLDHCNMNGQYTHIHFWKMLLHFSTFNNMPFQA